MNDSPPVEDQGIWRDLGETERLEIKRAMRVRKVARGETLIEQGEPSETLFIVSFGLFEVKNADNTQSVAEVGADQLIGEMGFFAGVPRTAAVVAARDSEVLEIDRTAFDELAKRCPKEPNARHGCYRRRRRRNADSLCRTVTQDGHIPQSVLFFNLPGRQEAFRDRTR
jgi:NTE family protein